MSGIDTPINHRHWLFTSLFLFSLSCSGPSSSKNEDPDLIRVSYLRFTKKPSLDNRSERIEPDYYVLLSESWNDRYGRSPREPFAKIFRHPFLGERVPDQILRTLLDELRDRGFDLLPAREPATIDLARLAAMPLETDPARLSAHRILSIEAGKYRRTVLYADLLDPSFRNARDRELNAIFLQCEQLVRKYGETHCLQVIQEAAPLLPPGR